MGEEETFLRGRQIYAVPYCTHKSAGYVGCLEEFRRERKRVECFKFHFLPSSSGGGVCVARRRVKEFYALILFKKMYERVRVCRRGPQAISNAVITIQ